jgi:outer membrane protein OmpA-like peptidoglycan-associated protein
MDRMKSALVTFALFAAASAQAAAPATQRNFVACPVVQDTSTVPCWLAEYRGETYYLGIQTDISAENFPPYLGHQALVEGTVTGEPRICGGVVLKPLKVSVLPDLAPQCNEIRPARAQFEVPFAPRGPGPSKGGLAFAPAPGTARAAAPAAPTPPFEARTFVVPYDFASQTVTGRTSRMLQQAVTYARAIKASRIEITGYRGQVLLSDGPALDEAPGIAEVRAKQIGDLMIQVGVPAAMLKLAWKDDPEPADGVTDAARRRTTIVVEP